MPRSTLLRSSETNLCGIHSTWQWGCHPNGQYLASASGQVPATSDLSRENSRSVVNACRVSSQKFEGRLASLEKPSSLLGVASKCHAQHSWVPALQKSELVGLCPAFPDGASEASRGSADSGPNGDEQPLGGTRKLPTRPSILSKISVKKVRNRDVGKCDAREKHCINCTSVLPTTRSRIETQAMAADVDSPSLR